MYGTNLLHFNMGISNGFAFKACRTIANNSNKCSMWRQHCVHKLLRSLQVGHKKINCQCKIIQCYDDDYDDDDDEDEDDDTTGKLNSYILKQKSIIKTVHI